VEYVPSGLSLFRVIWPKFNEATFNSAVDGLANEPAFLGRTVVVLAHARAAFISSDDRFLEGVFGEPVKVAAKDGLEIQSVTALKYVVRVEWPGDDRVAQREMSKQDGRAMKIEFGQILIEPVESSG